MEMKPPKHTPQGYVSTNDAAKMLDRHPSQVSRYIRAGLLKAVQIGNVYFIPEAELKNFRYPKPGPRRLSKRERTPAQA